MRGDSPSTLSHDPYGTPAAGLPGHLETQRGLSPVQPEWGPGGHVRFNRRAWACRRGGVPGSAPPCPLTLVLLHERPHVPLLWAVRKGAVPHVLALAAVLRMDAELQGRHGETLLSPAGLCHCPASGQALLGSHGPICEVPLPPCTRPRCSHRIAVGSCEWTAVASPTPTSSWPWTSPGGPAAPWSSCRIEQAV